MTMSNATLRASTDWLKSDYQTRTFANPADGFYIQEEPDEVPNGIARTKEDYGDITTPDTLDADDINHNVIDRYWITELIFDISTCSKCRGRVVKCEKGTSGKPIGCAHSEPLFDTQEYVVESTDGSTENYFANVIVECMYVQVEAEGNQYQLLSEITDHRSDNSAIQIADGFMISRNGNCVPKPTIRGWSLLVLWKDGSFGLVTTEGFKRCLPSPVQIAHYAAANKISKWTGIQSVGTYGTSKAPFLN